LALAPRKLALVLAVLGLVAFSGGLFSCTGVSDSTSFAAEVARRPAVPSLVAMQGENQASAPSPAGKQLESAPRLLFTDLVVATNTGNSDTSFGQTANQDGAYVTVWGRRLGSTQGNSKITLGAVPVRVLSWGNATAPADLYSKLGLQMIEFQVPHSVAIGSANLVVTVDGVVSNALPLTITNRGRIFVFAASGGSDWSRGTFTSPWETVAHAAFAMTLPGSITYVENGVTWSNPACLNEGTINQATAQLQSPGYPLAFVAYPGAKPTTSTMGFDTKGCGGEHAGVGNYVFSKFTMNITGASPYYLNLSGESRFIGNYVTAPNMTTCPVGALVVTGGGFAGGNNIYELGNEFGNIFSSSASQKAMCKLSVGAFYVSGNRIASTPVTESNREIGWNYIHDTYAGRGIEVYTECGSGISCSRGGIANYLTGVSVHDNWLENVRGEAIVMGSPVQEPAFVVGDNAIYNNVLINAGMGPTPYSSGADATSHVALLIRVPDTSVKTAIFILHNTLYGFGAAGGGASSGICVIIKSGPVTFAFHNNILYSTGQPYSCVPLPVDAYGNLYFGAGQAPTWDTSALSADPLFVDPARGDFHLAPSSPAVGSGSMIAPAMAAQFDFDSRPRWPGGTDLGAFQHFHSELQ
jgi:uncharacterized protein (TIGR03437 family)